jgi:hypothetical protein
MPPKNSKEKAKTIASQIVSGSLGDESWQIVSLGEVDLKAGAKIILRNIPNATRYTDLRRIVLVEPSVISETRPINDSLSK